MHRGIVLGDEPDEMVIATSGHGGVTAVAVAEGFTIVRETAGQPAMTTVSMEGPRAAWVAPDGTTAVLVGSSEAVLVDTGDGRVLASFPSAFDMRVHYVSGSDYDVVQSTPTEARV